MRYLIKFNFPNESGTANLSDPEFGKKVQQYLTDVKAEAAFFTAVNGTRGGYIVASFDDASSLPAVVEPLFIWLKADVEILPVMVPEDLMKAGPSIEAALKKWG
ncbi:MAG: hypothetical protein EPO24_10105 [Bacteroidetes bacterium]|nr:MAG: hypothetical protein EPO24_10105 [Bacteroidota bacterium]